MLGLTSSRPCGPVVKPCEERLVFKLKRCFNWEPKIDFDKLPMNRMKVLLPNESEIDGS